MKKIFLIIVIVSVSSTVFAQFIATEVLKEHIAGICNDNEVYVMSPGLDGQQEAQAPLSKDDIIQRLNNGCSFLNEDSKQKDTGIINIYINCKGEMVRCELGKKTKSKELDEQILAVFNSLGKWKAAELNGKAVDSTMLWGFKIKDGKFIND